MFKRIRQQLRRGVFFDHLYWRASGRMPMVERARWFGVRTPEQGARVLAKLGQRLSHDHGAPMLLVGDGGPLHRGTAQGLRRRGVKFSETGPADLAAPPAGRVAGVLCAMTQMRDITAVATAALRQPALADKPFEYVYGLDTAEAQFRRWDEYRDTFFASPLLLARVPVYEIYAESLRRFEQKCGLRDWLDLAQEILRLVDAGVPGDLAEFGSFRGHSGWLTASLLKALGSDKKLYMFDTFERFPVEDVGVDYFWSSTHDVNFEAVKAKFAELPNVRFVKGDFTRTLDGSGADRLALAYVDCDSYRATKYLVDAIFERRLSTGGALIVEDYGHPALLGSRLAVHETLAQRPGALCHYSQFSGLYFARKIPAGS